MWCVQALHVILLGFSHAVYSVSTTPYDMQCRHCNGRVCRCVRMCCVEVLRSLACRADAAQLDRRPRGTSPLTTCSPPESTCAPRAGLAASPEIRMACQVAATFVVVAACVRNVPQLLRCWRSKRWAFPHSRVIYRRSQPSPHTLQWSTCSCHGRTEVWALFAAQMGSP